MLTGTRLSDAIAGTFDVLGDAITDEGLTGPERRALYEDVALIQEQEGDSMVDAAHLLVLRIGGIQNLRSYVDCLMVPINKADSETRHAEAQHTEAAVIFNCRKIYEDTFDDAVDDATQAVIGIFDFLDLPVNDELSDLMVRVNDALTQLFEEYK